MSTATEHVNGTEVPGTSHAESWARAGVVDAEAEAIRATTAAEIEAKRIAAEAEAEAVKIKAREEAEKQRIVNERANLKLRKDAAVTNRMIAEEERKAAEARRAIEKAEQQAAEQAEAEAEAVAEQQRSEATWKWAARAIYAVGLIIAAPIQFLAFWDPSRPFMIAAPALLEGFALAFAFGAAWAVATRRDVAPYRVGIMLSALIAAGINLWHGLVDPSIGVDAGIIGAIASLGGPIVLMAYEHGIAQRADGVPSWRERRAAQKETEAAEKERMRAKAEKDAAAKKAAEDKKAAEQASEAEQQRKDTDRKQHHPDVWAVADMLRSARGSKYVTDQIWGDAWYRVTGSRSVGVTPESEAQFKAAQARMKTASEVPIYGEFSQVDSQKGSKAKSDPEKPDGRRHNGGTPPRRTPGDTAPYSDVAKRQAAVEQTAKKTAASGS